MLVVNERIQIPDEEIEFTYARSSGPGGQNVNKVASKAQMRWKLPSSSVVLPFGTVERMRASFPSRFTTEGEIILQSQSFRDQERNRGDCLEKLAEMIRDCLQAPRARKKTKPTYGSQLRRMEEKKRQSVRKQNRKPGND